MDALPELRAARAAWRQAKVADVAGAAGAADVTEARLRAMHTYITTRFRVACRGPGGDNATSQAWQRRLHLIEEILDTTRTAAQHTAWSQSPTNFYSDRMPVPPVVEASGRVRRYLDENHPTEHKPMVYSPGEMLHHKRKAPR